MTATFTPYGLEPTDQGNSYTLTTWSYYSAEPNPPRTSQPINADNNEAALALAEQAVPPGDVVGTLTAADGRIVARRNVIIHMADVGEGMRMNAGSWKFFAANDEAAKIILQEKTVDWMNILYVTDGVLARN